MEMREIHCDKAGHTSKGIQVFYTPIAGHSGIQRFTCPYCRQMEQWNGVPGEISRILINGPEWQEYHLFQTNTFHAADDFKAEALSRGFTKIRRDAQNAKEVLLEGWQGFSSHVSGGAFAAVTYYLEGNKLRVHKALENGDHWYTLT